MSTHSERMDQIQSELHDPKSFQPAELFLDFTKFGLIICNQFYDQTTMKDLAAVGDDFRNAKHTTKMMGILPENTFSLKDVSRKELDIHFDWIKTRIKVLTMVLVNSTGICGIGSYQ